MKIKTSNNVRQSEEPMISLINIIFLLLIFFMLMGRIEKSNLLDIDVPIATTVLKTHSFDHSLTVDRQGRIYINEKPFSLQMAVEQVKGWKKADKISNLQGLSIRADLQLENNKLNELFNALKAIELNKVKLTVVQK